MDALRRDSENRHQTAAWAALRAFILLALLATLADGSPDSPKTFKPSEFDALMPSYPLTDKCTWEVEKESTGFTISLKEHEFTCTCTTIYYLSGNELYNLVKIKGGFSGEVNKTKTKNLFFNPDSRNYYLGSIFETSLEALEKDKDIYWIPPEKPATPQESSATQKETEKM